ncbi:hypothetical protein E4S40_00725 [Algoriphagus kandeliae]|uniref:Glycosyltransferase family 1 protein n=1 Tax=Algoriphagus kandeliae TaxID=2562278 RepID=A0A4Y9R0A2_9BACT|nr:hypothetical protein [Algoriphagus kandeliae]TFV97212.1 hypothetical protein E4S40_00725 [Algoriphagus kandeliae]
MKNLLIVVECINKNKSSEGIATVNFLNAIDTNQFNVDCVFYEFPQFEISNPDWINPKIKLYQLKNNKLDFIFSKYSKIKNFFAKYFGISILKEYRIFRLKKYLNSKFENREFDLIFSRTIATSICSHRALISSTLSIKNNLLIYFNDPAPFCLMPYPYSTGSTFNPKFDQKEIKHVKFIISKSTAIASPSYLLNEFFLKLNGDYFKPAFTFPHLFFEDLVKKNFQPSVKYDRSKINITHCGSLLSGRDPSTLIEAIEEFVKMYPDFKTKISLNFFGPINNLHKKILNTNYYEFLNVVDKRFSHAESLALMRNSDLPLLIESSYEDSPFMPVKLAELIGLGKVFLVLSPKKSETRRVLGENYSFQTESNNKSEILAKIKDFVEDTYEKEILQNRIYTLQEYVSPESVNISLNKVINQFS